MKNNPELENMIVDHQVLMENLQRYKSELELKNRELDIESALEGVRTVAMEMKEPADMLEVCRVISEQLKGLGIEGLRNVQTAIFNIEKESYMNYEYFGGPDLTLITEVAYTEQADVHAFVKSMLSAPDAFFTTMMEGRQLSDFIAYQEQAGQYVDPQQYSADALNYYFFSIGSGALGISAYMRCSEEQISLIRRFRNVFLLAYRRYSDIKQAEAQAREAEIQLSLERVRARSLAMHHSDELQDVVNVVAQQLFSIGIDINGGVFIVINDEIGEDVPIWASAGMTDYVQKVVVPFLNKPFFINLRAALIKRNHFYIEQCSREEKLQLFEHLFQYEPWKSTPAERKKELLSRAGGLCRSIAISHYTSIAITDHYGKKFSEEENEILARFGKVFEQSYIRFLDLHKAEAQAREAQVELSLERIRAQVLAMQESSDLQDIVVMMRNEFVALGHEAHYFWYMRWLPDKYEKAMTSGDGTRIGMVMNLPRHIHGDIRLVADWEKSEEPILVFAMDVETAVAYVHKMITLGDFELVDPQAPTLDDIRHIGGLTFVMARTTHGEIGYSLPGTIPNPSPGALALLARFAGVFDLAYKRFLDLQLKEFQSAKLKEEKERLEQTLDELKVTQNQLIHAEKMASLGELTAGIAHEIQNPLNFVNNFSEVSKELLGEMKDELAIGNWQLANEIASDVEQNLDKIHHHGKRADAIVKGMLQHSRSSSGVKELTNINALCEEYLRLAYHGMKAKDKSIEVSFHFEPDSSLPEMNVVSQDIGRVLLNLINNAFYAVAEKGQNSGSDYQPKVSVKSRKLDNKVEISIADNGNGIPEAILDKIFQPFFTTKPTGQGTGLGLSLSYDIVKAHGGELRVEKRGGEGSVFIIQLPVV